MLSVCAYIDLNPVSAGIVAIPEGSSHTSIKERVEHAKAEARIAEVSEIRNGSVAATAVNDGVHPTIFLGLPRGRSVDSKPNRIAVFRTHPASP